MKKVQVLDLSVFELHALLYVHTIWKYRINTVCLFLCAVLILFLSVRVVLIRGMLTFSMLAAAAAATAAICFRYLRWTVWVLCHILRNRANGNSALVTSHCMSNRLIGHFISQHKYKNYSILYCLAFSQSWISYGHRTWHKGNNR